MVGRVIPIQVFTVLFNPHKEADIYRFLDLVQNVRPQTILDVGAAEGSIFLYFRYLDVLSDARHVFIDCMAENIPCYEMIRQIHRSDYCIGAAGDQSGTAKIRVDENPYWTQRSDIVGPGYHTASFREVPCFRIDQLVAERGYEAPFLLRLDVQGAEAMVLAGATGIAAHTPIITIEISVMPPPDTAQSIWDWLARHGYGVLGLINFDYGTRSARAHTFYIVAVHAHLLSEECMLVQQHAPLQARQDLARNREILAGLLGETS